MKLTFVSTVLGFPWGGADSLWTKAAEAASARGDSLQFVISPLTRDHPRIEALVRAGAEVVLRSASSVPRGLSERAKRSLARFLRSGDSAVTAIARFRPDRVLVSCGATYDLLAEPALADWLLATGTAFRVIANYQVEHPALAENERVRIRHLFARAENLLFVSQRNLASTRRHLLDPLPQATVLHNPLRCGPGDAVPMSPSPPFRLATVSRLDSGKGVDLALHAVTEALRGEENWELDIFGRGPLESYLRETIEHLGLGKRVQLRGHVSSLQEIWSTRHLLISPSIEDGVPMTIPEAMLHGRPVLATAVGGAEDWIVSGQNGFLCPAATKSLLTDGLRTAWQQRDRWLELGRQAAADAAQRYRPDDFLKLIAA